MKERLNFFAVDSRALKSLYGLEVHLAECGLIEQARKQFDEVELVNLTLAVVAINAWNRLNIAFRTVPGTYQPGSAAAR